MRTAPAIKLQTGVGPGLSGAGLCITRRLAKVATSQSVLLDRRQRRNDMIVDTCIGIAIPVIIMIASVVVQPHRFDLVEGFGCNLPLWLSIPAVCIIPLWPIVFSLASSIYGSKSTRKGLGSRIHALRPVLLFYSYRDQGFPVQTIALQQLLAWLQIRAHYQPLHSPYGPGAQ